MATHKREQPALQAVQTQLQDGERLFAFLDGVYVVCSPHRVNAIHGLLQHALFAHSSIRVHHGKTQVWNRGGVIPAGVEVLQAVARVNDPGAIVWWGDPTLRSEEQGVRILGTPLCHPGSSVLSWRLCLRHTISCWRRSLPSRIFSAPGWSCCGVQPTTHSESSTLSSQPVSQRTMTHLSENASADSWGWLLPTSTGI